MNERRVTGVDRPIKMLERRVEVAGLSVQHGQSQARTATLRLAWHQSENAAHRFTLSTCVVGVFDLFIGALPRGERLFRSADQLCACEVLAQRAFQITLLEVRA